MVAPSFTVPALMLIAPVVVFTPVSNKLSAPTLVILPAPDIIPEIRIPFTELIVMFADVVDTDSVPIVVRPNLVA